MKKARILIVEDEANILAINKKHLEKQGYDVITAQSLAEASSAVWEYPPDLVLLDVLMPDGSGFDFCRSVKEITTAPIIFLTCMNSDADVLRGFSAGGDDYITKPYNLDELSVRIVAMLRRGRFSGAGRIEIPPLYIDLLNGRVTLCGENIVLSQKELQLLSCLASSIGQEFTSRELYELVWDASEDMPTGTTVKSHISRLRRKLKLSDTGAFELRHTASGRYMLIKIRF